MKKYILGLTLILTALFANAQFPSKDSLRSFNNRFVNTNPQTAFTNNRLNILLNGIINMSGDSGSSALPSVDTLFTINDSTLRYKKGGSYHNIALPGRTYSNGYGVKLAGTNFLIDSANFRKVDSIYVVNDSTINFSINGVSKSILVRGTGSSGSSSRLGNTPTSTTVPIKDSASGSITIISSATKSIAGAFNAHDKTKVDYYEPATSYDQLRAITNLDAMAHYFLRYNGTVGEFSYDAFDVSTADDSATVVVTTGGGRLKRVIDRVVNVKWWGATGDGSTNDYVNVQRAINYVCYHTINTLYFPAGTYKNTTKGWLIWRDFDQDGQPDQVNVQLIGEATANGSDQGNEVRFLTTYTQGFVFGFERNKGSRIRNFTFEGPNVLNYSLTTAFNSATTYTIGSGIGSRQVNPLTCIVFDPIGEVTDTLNKWPGFDDHYVVLNNNGGSTDCIAENLTISGYYDAVLLTGNEQTQNNEQHILEDIWVSNCYNGLQINQKQARNCYVKNWKLWNSVHTCFFSVGGSEAPILDNVNIAGNIYSIFNVSGDVLSANKIFAESFYTIGSIGTSVAKITNSQFNPALPQENGIRGPNSLLNTTTHIEFDNCQFVYTINDAAHIPMNLAINGAVGSVKFNNCFLFNEFNNTYENGDASEKISYENCTFWKIPGTFTSTPQTFNLQEFVTHLGGNEAKYLNLGTSYTTYSPIGSTYYATQIRTTTTPWLTYNNGGNLTITVSGNYATTAAGGAYVLGATPTGTIIKIVTGVPPLITAGGMTLDSVSSDGTGHFSRVIEGITSGTYSIYIPQYNAMGYSLVGDVTYGSNVISNITAEVSGTAADIGGFYINGLPTGVTSHSAGTATTTTTFLYTGRVVMTTTPTQYTETGILSMQDPNQIETYVAEKILFTAGSRYGKWTVLKSGICNTSVKPVFGAVDQPIPFYDSTVMASVTTLKDSITAVRTSVDITPLTDKVKGISDNAVIYFHENFDRTTANIAGSTNGVPGSSAIPVSVTPWYATFGSGSSPVFTSGGAAGNVGVQIDTTNQGVADSFEVSIKIKSATVTAGGIMLFNSCQNTNNYLQLVLTSDPATSYKALDINQVISGTGTNIASGTYTINDGDIIRERVTNGVVSIYLNNVYKGGGAFNKSVINGTTMGIQWATTASTIDYIKVTGLPLFVKDLKRSGDSVLADYGQGYILKYLDSLGSGGGYSAHQIDSIARLHTDSVFNSLAYDLIHTVTTTGATATTIDTLTTPADMQITYELAFHFTNTSNNDRGEYVYQIGVADSHGTVSQDFSTIISGNVIGSSLSSVSIAFPVVSGQVLAQVTGATSTNILWTVSRTLKVKSALTP